MATIMLTGITGTIMAPLAALLVSRGHTIVALVRPQRAMSAGKRLEALGYAASIGKNLFAIPGDICEPLAGVPVSEQATWRDRIDSIVHGAASTRFYDTPQNKEVWQTNVEGTRHLLELASILNVREFHYVSTAYVVGDAPSFAENDLNIGQHTRNDYEESKKRAEELVRLFWGNKASIYRIPIVVGDSRTGEINSFTGYYGFFSAFWEIRSWLLEAWRTRESACRNAGILVDGDKTISIPLSLHCSEGPLNLVPIDWAASIMADLIERRAEGKTFHITNPHPPTIRYTIEESLSLLGFRNVVCGSNVPREKLIGIAQVIQRAINRGIEIYQSYILKEKERFDNTTLMDTLRSAGKMWAPPPVFDRELFRTLLIYAVSRNFGRS
ncbi:MAG: SDR family oxidoreductase [Candidatus Binatia bacterium]